MQKKLHDSFRGSKLTSVHDLKVVADYEAVTRVRRQVTKL
jgi:hypothetical protein